jgi:hypothetical protein
LALALWMGASIAAIVRVMPAEAFRAPSHAVLLALLSPAVLFMLSIGQATALLALLFIGGLRLMETRPAIAGVLFGLLSIKPHLCLLLPFVLLIRRAWLVIAYAAATVTVMVVVSLIAFGFDPWQAYIANTMPYQSRVLATPFGFVWTLMVSPYAWYAKLGAGFATAMTLHVLTALAVTILALRAYANTHRRDPALAIAVLATASIVVVPYSLNYDLVIPVLAIAAWLAQRTLAVPLMGAVALAAFWVLPVVGQVLYLADIFVLWPSLAGALAALLWLSRDSKAAA